LVTASYAEAAFKIVDSSPGPAQNDKLTGKPGASSKVRSVPETLR
jgi:hypothetical protein